MAKRTVKVSPKDAATEQKLREAARLHDCFYAMEIEATANAIGRGELTGEDANVQALLDELGISAEIVDPVEA